jgi:hypothetical protein
MIFCSTEVDLSGQQCDTIFVGLIVINLVTPKAALKYELLFNKQASALRLSLSKSKHYPVICAIQCDQKIDKNLPNLEKVAKQLPVKKVHIIYIKAQLET